MLKQIINEIKQGKYKEDSYLWSNLIVGELIKKDYNLAVQWVSKCIQSYLFNFKPSRYIELNDYVQQALDSQKVLNASQYQEIGLKIWNLTDRENAQTAVSRLWCAIAAFKLGYDDAARRELAVSVFLLFSDKFDFNRFDLYITKARKIYEEYESETK